MLVGAVCWQITLHESNRNYYFQGFGTCSLEQHPCDDEIYCHGSLLHTVQLKRLYNDSKTFVDRPIKKPRTEVTQNFIKFMEVGYSLTGILYSKQEYGHRYTIELFDSRKDWKKHQELLEKALKLNSKNLTFICTL
jgi:hypothetical protein